MFFALIVELYQKVIDPLDIFVEIFVFVLVFDRFK